ncbi:MULTISPECIES: serine hydrolase [Pseudoalteromonas]|uniref:serine-type D-Ala-D-Ala carboxypeptidase n=1 Tax=Pseudoalteromonas ruthenica TaxID=151081 RepID=A0A0F4PRC2_9GAMM|nr:MULTISPECIES: serine hydrolase [Pseudoalteromonas]KJY96017.1 D-alanyl-D-alanine carboxypeptidase [Pseudoalteromonas ruthenica]KJY96831.1 D-alanyl-D-alanine carboxypeptidase [Pseudoalteromonas ruthenica]MCF2863572.1 serine hydrolase [Pseudoalteromonas sp. CNAT2-18]MCG7558525.1 serine hydrolase [Pseudoalteromonas sp. CNAT2-18.1]MCG7567548.1 serine hydrolase [Pseudoalteromonas sp. CnMc7-15]|tara:strand:+ start:616 stop:1776 length:1161 start_codon:yes stop_codon:yes gene_type:complete
MKSIKHSLLKGLGGLLCASSVFAAQAQIIPAPPEVNAKGHFLVDFTTGKVIAEGEADTKLAPASLTKMMTSYVIGTEINAGNISPSDMVTVSENAWAKNFPESSKMFIEVGKQVSVEDLNRGIIIQSGNDACVAMAEHIAGSESAFADLMNAHAQKLGMDNSHFINSHGLDTNEHFTTPRDMATLGAALIRDVPDEYALYKEKDFTYNGIKQFNRNSLLWDQGLDVDGIKTGHTSEAGYSLVSSATKGDMRLIAVVMGASSERARKVESKKLLNYGFRFFETITPYKAGDKFADQRIWMGDKETVALGILEDTPITIPRGQQKNLEANFELDTTLEAPLEKGTKVGTLYLQLDGEDVANYPLVTLESIEEGGFFSKIYDYLRLQIM